MKESVGLIHQRALHAARDYKRAEASLIQILADVEKERVFIHYNSSSLFQYSVKILGLSDSVSYNLIAVMRKSREVPALQSKIAAGAITLSNAKRIAPVLTVENQDHWLDRAEHLSQRQLEREVIKVKPKLATPERATYVNESRVKLEFGLNENAMLKLRRAQDLVSQFRAKSATLEDTLIEMMELYLRQRDPLIRARRVIAKKGSNPVKTPVSRQVVSDSGKTSSSPVDQDSKETEARKLVQTDQSSSKQPSFARQPIPAKIRHQIQLRDEGQCAHRYKDGSRCAQRRWLDIHHLTQVSDGGTSELANLITLCSTHHRERHRSQKKLA